MANQGGQNLYTRAGSLTLDAVGNLVTPGGGILQGWTANPVFGQSSGNSFSNAYAIARRGVFNAAHQSHRHSEYFQEP